MKKTRFSEQKIIGFLRSRRFAPHDLNHACGFFQTKETLFLTFAWRS